MTLDQRQAQTLMEAAGWVAGRGGKHALKMTKDGERPFPLPSNKGRDYPPGLARAILKIVAPQ